MTLINGLGRQPILGSAEQACVDLLEETLELAKEGKITSIGIIVCMQGGYATVMAGKQAGDLNMGADSLKHKIISAVEGGNVARPSSILRSDIGVR